MQLTFDILRRAWDALKAGNAQRVRRALPGLIAPQAVFVKRVQEDPHYLTVEFRGFENAVQNPGHDIPIVKRSILQWLRKFSSSVQIQRGEMPTMIVRLDKNIRTHDGLGPAMAESVATVTSKYEAPKRPPNLTNIVQVRPVQEND